MKHLMHLFHLQRFARFVWALLLSVPLLALSAQGQGNAAYNLHDSAFSAGGSGGAIPPAAFSGSERPDTGSFVISSPILSLPGRGFDLKLDLNYDSALYENRFQQGVGFILGNSNHRADYGAFNIGFGYYVIHNQTVNCHNSPLTCGNAPVGYPPGAVPFFGATYFDSRGVPYRYGDVLFGDEGGKPTVTYPDGTKILFGSHVYTPIAYSFNNGEWVWNNTNCRQTCDVGDIAYLPTKISDRNGNFITITYDDNIYVGAISTITDTLGRVVKFHYGGNWWSITTPDTSASGEHVVARFHYVSSLYTRFKPCDPNHPFVSSGIDYVVFPDTGMGWHYTYSPYGEISRVEKLVDMNIDANDNLQTFSVAAVTEYDYPTSPGLCTIPTYTTRTDRWADQNGTLSAPIVHQFATTFDTANHRSVTTVTAPDQTITETIRRYYSSQEHTTEWQATWDEGLILQTKTTKDGKTYSQVNNNWGTAPTPRGPRLLDVVRTDDAGHQAKAVFTYFDPASGSNGLWDNVHTKTEYKFDSTVFDSSTEVRRTEYTYETNGNYLSRGLMKLVKSVKVFQGGATSPLFEENYSYDTGTLTTYANLPATYNQSTPSERGNLTVRSANTNAASPGDGVTVTSSRVFDVLGNVVQTTDANNHTSSFDFTDSFSDGRVRNTYAYPTTASSAAPDPSGASGSASPLIQNAVYDFYTGLVSSFTDIRGQNQTFTYDLAQRVKEINRPDGSYTHFEYGDASGNLFVRTLTLQQATPTQSIIETREYFNGLGQTVRSFRSEGGTWLATDTKYDVAGRNASVSNPYRVDSLTADINPANNWTTTVFDPIGRTTSITTPDGAQGTSDYDGPLTLTSDSTNRKRLTKSDELGQTTDIWEMTTDSGSEAVTFKAQNLSGYHTQYFYDVLGNLRRVTQGTQQRYFTFDSLSRLIRVRNPEQLTKPSLSLNDAMIGNSEWTIAYDYDNNGNLKHRTDARGVVTTYGYDALNRPVSRSYANDPAATPNVSYVYDLQGKGLLASVSSSVSTCQYNNYDVLGRAKTITEQIGSQSYLLHYDYDLVGHIKNLQYASNNNASYSYDAAGRLQSFTGTLGDGGQPQNYATGISYDASGGWTREQFGTTVPLFNKRHYNNRLMLYDMRVSTVNDDTNWNRGKIINYYSLSNPTEGGTAADTNGDLYRQQHWVPTNDAIADYSYIQFDYTYDAQNRVKYATDFQRGTDWIRPNQYEQSFDYDRWGNRTINSAAWGVNNKQFDNSDAATTNRLYAPGDTALPMNQRQMRYDEAGNLTHDTYTGEGDRVYDAEGRIIQAWANGQWQYYYYDGEGRRIKRKINSVETTQILGLGGELLAEYPLNGDPLHPQIEYGYRNGELLITAKAPVTGGGGGPAALTTTSASSVTLNWTALSGAGNYRVERKAAGGNYASIGSAGSPTFIDGGAALGSAYLYRVCAADGSGNCISNYSNIGMAAPWNFPTDPTTIVGYSEDPGHATTINANHITELRTAVNAVRHLAGMGDGTWTHPANHGDPIYVEDVRELRQKLDEALGALGLPTPPYQTDPTLVGLHESANATPIKAAHIRELRQRATSVQGNADIKLPLVGADCSKDHSPPYDDSHAIDGNYDDLWSAGDFAPQWIQVDLGQTRTVSRIRMLVDQYPNGHTTHQVYGGPTPDNLSWLGTFDGDTVFHQWLELNSSLSNIRYIRVWTTASPSWVGWAEIEVFGPAAAAAPAQLHWMVTDQLGTPRMVFDRSGSLTVSDQAGNFISGVTRHDYLPFGEELAAGISGRIPRWGYAPDGVRQQFAQYERDETNLDFAQARHYSNIAGRFTRPDPLMASANLANPQSWNRYTYCGNDPLDFNDPSGLDWYQDNFEQGVTHPHWFEGAPPADPGRWSKWYQFTYFNVETRQWWWVAPHAFLQGPAVSELEALTVVGHFEQAYQDANYQAPTPAYLGDFAAEWNGRYAPAQNRAMEIMGAYMFLFTGPTGEMSELTSLSLKATDVAVSSGAGGVAAEMSVVRIIEHGEKLEDIINEGKTLTFETGNEHALVKLVTGERALVSGNEYGISFGEQATRVFGHTHPFQFPASGPSPIDRAALRALGQRSSWLFEHGQKIKFGQFE